MMHAEWLPVVMQGAFNEIYIFDCETLRCMWVNQAACSNLQYREQDLIGKTLVDITQSPDADRLTKALRSLRAGRSVQKSFNTKHARKDGSTYPVELRLLYCPAGVTPAFIAIGNDISARHDAAKALSQSESRFLAVSSNTPGLAYQFILQPDGSTSFPYLSDGCHALLGIRPDRLRADPSLFVGIILPEDRPAYHDSMRASAVEMKDWNWEGRIWVEEWKDVKWINLRSTPRLLSDHSTQWDGIMTNITQSKHEQAEIRRSRAQLAELSAHIDIVKEQERTRIAREIHDDLGGNLTAIKMALALLTRRLPTERNDLLEKAAYVDALVDRTIEATHRIAGDLRPSLLDFGVVAAIDWHAKEFEKQVGIPCEFSSNRKHIDLPADHATALFRIFQEALTNIAKHAHASRVTVRLVRTNRSLRLEVADNGRGIAPSDRTKPQSFGIRGMMERASALGGNLSIAAATDGGSIVTIKIPLPAF